MANLSAREQQVAAAAWRCIPANEFPKVNFDTLASVAEINTAKTASNTWGALKKKIIEAEDPMKVDLTERELFIARVAWLCIDAGNIPKIDTARMVEMGVFKTAKTASNTWWSIKKKLQANNGGGNNTTAGPSTPGQPVTPTTGTTTGKRKAATSAQGTADAATPSKKPRKARKTKASTQVKEETAETTENTPAEETPAEETPAEETPAEETPAEETYAYGAYNPFMTGAVFASVFENYDV